MKVDDYIKARRILYILRIDLKDKKYYKELKNILESGLTYKQKCNQGRYFEDSIKTIKRELRR